MAAVLSPTEDEVFDAVWGAISALFAPEIADTIFKGFQNMTATPGGSYVVIQPGVTERQDQLRHDYDAEQQLVLVKRHTTYSYQVDCYGPKGPDTANTIAIAWRSVFMANYVNDNALPFQVLYADEPQQLNIVNGEKQYEQRFMAKLYLQVNQTVALPQDFFTSASIVTTNVPGDDLPVSV